MSYPSSQTPCVQPRQSHGFSLLEVMIAVGIFFMVAFTVLALVSQCLQQARALEQVRSPIGTICSDAMLVEPLEEGSYSGHFGDVHPDYQWDADVFLPEYEIITNDTLMAIDLTVRRSGRAETDGEVTILKFQSRARGSGFTQKGAFWE